MVSSLLHALPPIAPGKPLPVTTAATTSPITGFPDNHMMMNEKQTLTIRHHHPQRRSITASSFHGADPFLHSSQDIRDVASAFRTSVDVAQSVRDLISFLLFKPTTISMVNGASMTENIIQEAVLIPQANDDGEGRRKSKSLRRNKLSSSKSIPISHWPSCVAPPIPSRRNAASSNRSSSNSISMNDDSTTSGNCLGIPAAQQMRPGWTMSHIYVRDTRINANELRMLATEGNMIRNAKITRPLRNRRYLDKRQDDFVWGCRSCLRIYDNGAGDHNK